MLYCILDIEDLHNVPYKHYREQGMQVIQDTASTVETNLDNTKFTIGFVESNPPEVVQGKTTYTGAELMDIIDDPSNGWITED